jgi:hypothetical protein
VILVTGSTGGQGRVWAVQESECNVATEAGTDKETVSDTCDDDVFQYMSSLILSPHISPSTERCKRFIITPMENM